MKRFKNTYICLLSLLGMLSSHPSTAQETNAAAGKKIRVEIRAGVTSSNFRAPFDDRVHPSAPKAGLYGGAVLGLRLSESMSFLPGLVLTGKGGKLDVMHEGDKALNVNAVYLQLPLYLSFRLPVNKYSNSFNINLGPYLACGVGGKATYKPSGNKSPVSLDSFGSGGPLNRIDAGLGLEVQFELKGKVVFTLGSEMGVAPSLKKVSGTNAIIGNGTGYLSVGYRL